MTWPGAWESVDDAILTVVAAWNVFGLPALLAVVAVASSLARSRAKANEQALRDSRGRAATVRKIGLIHYGLALWAAVWLAGELRSYAEQGGFPANPVFTEMPWLTLGALCDLAVGFGLRRLSRRARVAAALLALWRSGLDVLFAVVGWRHGATLDWTEWPRLAVSYALPPFLAVVLLLPGSSRAFRTRDDNTDAPPTRLDWSLSLLVRLWLVVIGSVVATDALDTALRFVGDRWSAGS
jgi:hypothetical protein